MNSSTFKRIMRTAVRIFDVMGPVILSAFSILISFCILQPIALLLDPTFSLLASRGVGKIAFTVLVILHIFLLLSVLSKKLLNDFLQTNLYFICSTKWIVPFGSYFLSFFAIHSFILGIIIQLGHAQWHPEFLKLIPSNAVSLLMGFIATFFLAWTEEAIFRGALFTVLQQRLAPMPAIITTSLIFMFAHDLTNPINLLTTKWALGLGLFLLGIFLNMLFFLTNKLYIGMGAHAGLVFVKVVLRRIPLISYMPTIPWWIDSDLRQSIIIHLLFVAVILFLLIIFRKKLFTHSSSK